jgi:hypothetical protein
VVVVVVKRSARGGQTDPAEKTATENQRECRLKSKSERERGEPQAVGSVIDMFFL